MNHSKKEYARGAVHTSSADGFAAILERAQFGVYHWTSRQHLQRYVDEAVFRWNQRRWIENGKGRYKRLAMGFADGLKALLKNAVGRQVRRTASWGLWWPQPIAPTFKPAPDFLVGNEAVRPKASAALNAV